MALTDKKILQADTDSNKIADLALQPDMSGDELQERFDRLAMQIIIPRFNSLIDELAGAFVASGITNGEIETNSGTTVAAQLTYLLGKIIDLRNLTAGSIADGSVTDVKLSKNAADLFTRFANYKTSTDAALTGRALTTHTHDAANINSGTLAFARIPTGATSTTVAAGNHTHSYAATDHTHTPDKITDNGTTKLAIGIIPTGTAEGTVALGSHTHDASGVASGTLALARIPTGTTGTTVAYGNHGHATLAALEITGAVAANDAQVVNVYFSTSATLPTSVPDGTLFIQYQ